MLCQYTLLTFCPNIIPKVSFVIMLPFLSCCQDSRTFEDTTKCHSILEEASSKRLMYRFKNWNVSFEMRDLYPLLHTTSDKGSSSHRYYAAVDSRFINLTRFSTKDEINEQVWFNPLPVWCLRLWDLTYLMVAHRYTSFKIMIYHAAKLNSVVIIRTTNAFLSCSGSRIKNIRKQSRLAFEIRTPS